MLIICAMHNCHEIISGNIREVFGYIAVLETNLKPNFMILSSVIKRLTVSTTLRVLRVEKQILRVDRRMLRIDRCVERRVLRVNRRVTRVGKQVLRILQVVREVLRVIRPIVQVLGATRWGLRK